MLLVNLLRLGLRYHVYPCVNVYMPVSIVVTMQLHVHVYSMQTYLLFVLVTESLFFVFSYTFLIRIKQLNIRRRASLAQIVAAYTPPAVQAMSHVLGTRFYVNELLYLTPLLSPTHLTAKPITRSPFQQRNSFRFYDNSSTDVSSTYI